MALTTGKLVLYYVGEHGRHTELYIEDELVVAGFNCNKSIMLLLWCACDSMHVSINDYIESDFIYQATDLGAWLCRNIFKPQLYSQYDILMTKHAAAQAYYDMIYKQNYVDPITAVLSARRDLFNWVAREYKIDNMEVSYVLNESEIYANG